MAVIQNMRDKGSLIFYSYLNRREGSLCPNLQHYPQRQIWYTQYSRHYFMHFGEEKHRESKVCLSKTQHSDPVARSNLDCLIWSSVLIVCVVLL